MTASLPSARFNPLVDFWHFWTKPIRAEPLALFRILLGANLLVCWLFTIAPEMSRWIGADGLCPTPSVDPYLKDTGRFCLLRGPVSIPYLEGWVSPERAQAWKDWGAEPANAYLLFALYMVSLVFVTLGLFTRPALIMAWVLGVTFHHRLADVLNGGDAVSRMALFYLMISPAGAVWSLDSRWRRRRALARARAAGLPPPPEQPVLIPAWSVRLAQIQVCLLYLFTGLNKLGEDFFNDNWYNCDWLNGEAVYWAFNDAALTRWPYWLTPFPLWACRVLSWGTMLFEIGFVFFVLFREFRPYILLAGVALHLGIFVHIEIAWFSQFSLCWYVLFLEGETLERFFQRVGRLWPFGRAAHATRAPAPAPVPVEPCPVG